MFNVINQMKIYLGNPSPSVFHLFSALKNNLGGHS
jgi:hypothetical protein